MAEAGRYQLSGNAAQTYERDLVAIFNRPLTEIVFEHVTLHEGERVLDTACGTGIVTRVALERFKGIKTIVGVDLNSGMLDVARENTPATETLVEWHEGDICHLPFPDASFDIVMCQQGLQYIPDKLTALREMRRVLVSDGRLAFTVWSESNRQAIAMNEAMQRHLGPEVVNQLGGSAWNDAEAIREIVAEAGWQDITLEIVEFEVRMPATDDIARGQVDRALRRTQFDDEIKKARRAIEADMLAILEAYRVGDEFVTPSRTYLVQARTI